MTYPHITSKLERKILAAALYSFRQIPKMQSSNKWIVFASSIDAGAIDLAYIDPDSWTLDHVDYKIYEGNNKKSTKKTIFLK